MVLFFISNFSFQTIGIESRLSHVYLKDNLLAFATLRSYGLWDLTKNEQIWIVRFDESEWHRPEPAHVVIHNNFVITCDNDNYVRIRDINDGKTKFKVTINGVCYQMALRF